MRGLVFQPCHVIRGKGVLRHGAKAEVLCCAILIPSCGHRSAYVKAFYSGQSACRAVKDRFLERDLDNERGKKGQLTDC